MSGSGDLKSLSQLFFDRNSTTALLGTIKCLQDNWVESSYKGDTAGITSPTTMINEENWNQMIQIAGPGGCMVGWMVMLLFKNHFLQKKSNRRSGVARLLNFGTNSVPVATFVWLACNIAYSMIFSNNDAKGEGGEGEDEINSFVKYFTHASMFPNYFVTGIFSVILDMVLRRIQTSKIVSTLLLLPGVLAGIISLAFWIDNSSMSSLLLGAEYNDNHAILIKGMSYILAGWYCYACVVTQIFGCKKFTSFPCFLLVIFIGAATTSGMIF